MLRRKGLVKDTLRNIEQTGEFVINMVHQALARDMVETSAEFEPDVDEFKRCGVGSIPSNRVKPPRVEHAYAAMECELFDLYPIRDDRDRIGATMVLGRGITVPPTMPLTLLPLPNYEPVARLGGRNYLSWGEQFSMKPSE